MKRRRFATRLLKVGICVVFMLTFVHHVFNGVFRYHIAVNSFVGTQPEHLAVVEPEGGHRSLPKPSLDAVLFPDWEVFLLSHSITGVDPPPEENATCVFAGGHRSPARHGGVYRGMDMHRCELPLSLRTSRSFKAPALARGGHVIRAEGNSTEMARWNRLVYETLSTPDNVIVFAKGINRRLGFNNPAAILRCVFLSGEGEVIATTNASVSAQEVFRCAHPDPLPALEGPVRISLRFVDETTPLRTLAVYGAPEPEVPAPPVQVCVSTMVYNVAKFLPEWVTYHSAIGAQRFILYDNGSEDDLGAVVARLAASGHNITVVQWPWPKTQEAGFSHSAVAHRGSCTWTAFIDVDEFIFSPSWAALPKPHPSMLPSLLPAGPGIAEVWLNCLDFAPSGLLSHPPAGVTQGYTCRRRAEERHKSLVRLNAVAGPPNATLENVVHHFDGGWKRRRLRRSTAAVYHYKYQAWEEFKSKFRRRVSAYVTDWKEPASSESKDRAPGLGPGEVKPEDWALWYCDVNDTSLAQATRNWFGSVDQAGRHVMAWQA